MAFKIEELIVLADRLDLEGRHKEAAQIDEMVKKLSVSNDPDADKELSEEELLQRKRDIITEMGAGLMSAHVADPKKLSPQEGEGLSDALKAELANLMDKGWNIFAPGELEMWRPQQETTKVDPEDVDKFLKERGIDLTAQKLAGVVEQDLPEYQPESYQEQEKSVSGVQDSSMQLRDVFDSFLSSPSEWHDRLAELIGGYRDSKRLPEKMESEEDVSKHREELEGMTPEEIGETVLASNNSVFEKLANIADRLDVLGAVDEAELIDGFIKRYAEEDSDYQGEDMSSEQSKRYDSKYHHSLQIREPKTKQERVDREGREKHHVHTMQSVEATALSTRYCPEHVGVPVSRVGESTYQCSLDGAIFNYETGWTDHDGNEHPGGSLAAQTPDSSGYATPHRMYDSRENILNRVT